MSCQECLDHEWLKNTCEVSNGTVKVATNSALTSLQSQNDINGNEENDSDKENQSFSKLITNGINHTNGNSYEEVNVNVTSTTPKYNLSSY